MTSDRAQSGVLSKNQKLAMGAATICFLIGWFHTGQGLANYKILGIKYGSYILATGVLLIMTLAYNKAIKGSRAGLGFYLLFAMITFVCNLNSFYPNYRADSLIRDELRQHRTNLGGLRESIKTQFQDTKLSALAQSVESKSNQLQVQCRQRGCGPLAEQILKDIEKELERTITRLRQCNTQDEWDGCAKQYEDIIKTELKAKLESNRYLDKANSIRYAEDGYTTFSKKIEKTLVDRIELKEVPTYIEDLIKDYRDYCKKAMSLIADEQKNSSNQVDKDEVSFNCDQNYASPNIEIGKFSHTFKSVWVTRDDGGTWAVFLIALFIDFLMPLALYLLVQSDSTASRSGNFWTIGEKGLGPTVRE